jgi:hypothetical protein
MKRNESFLIFTIFVVLCHTTREKELAQNMGSCNLKKPLECTNLLFEEKSEVKT